jgi:hypothetical protein
MHPFLLPSEWLVTGRFFDLEGGETVTAGATIVRASESFPELLEVSVELRELGDQSYRPMQTSTYHLEITGVNQVRFRMDSTTLGTVLTGSGTFTSRSLTMAYRSPDRAFSGFEVYTVQAAGQLLTCGSFVAEGALVKTWEVSLDKVPDDGKRKVSIP